MPQPHMSAAEAYNDTSGFPNSRIRFHPVVTKDPAKSALFNIRSAAYGNLPTLGCGHVERVLLLDQEDMIPHLPPGPLTVSGSCWWTQHTAIWPLQVTSSSAQTGRTHR
jgi:hypothetical protein